MVGKFGPTTKHFYLVITLTILKYGFQKPSGKKEKKGNKIKQIKRRVRIFLSVYSWTRNPIIIKKKLMFEPQAITRNALSRVNSRYFSRVLAVKTQIKPQNHFCKVGHNLFEFQSEGRLKCLLQFSEYTMSSLYHLRQCPLPRHQLNFFLQRDFSYFFSLYFATLLLLFFCLALLRCAQYRQSR